MSRGRPRIPVLSAELIAREALALIDAEGADAFSLPRLAARLGVKTASLYNHLDGRAEVIEGVRRLVVEEMDVSAFDTLPWPDALAAWARSYRDAFARHPNSIDLLATTTISSPATLTMYEAVVTALARGGWPQERLVATLTSVESFLLGSALDLVAPPLMIDPAGHAPRVPVLAAALESAVGGSKAGRADEAFASGLDALIRGLVAQLAEVRGE
ncbi:TetR/AcrR family transcriptional regulator C-terminal domain-containing protein [Streptomyces sp. NBC_01381]|uniref:TetR/AcrR family transcriptional regulator n=1 Tax=Streptomyces sp. NBC_01381 TaxID=2903845 RepID=UPI0022598623|nr:TetR/AcrR family transcriptional regulator C-terminal domain-containing protein [Streptomyces sp. NBC_01381]MCX4668871.1 TetR/AcrR family transcriptional regulator C-terminal domain-containing protein [Streptomyces sp. NBC_01381]